MLVNSGAQDKDVCDLAIDHAKRRKLHAFTSPLARGLWFIAVSKSRLVQSSGSLIAKKAELKSSQRVPVTSLSRTSSTKRGDKSMKYSTVLQRQTPKDLARGAKEP